MRKWLPELCILAAGFLIGKLVWGDVDRVLEIGGRQDSAPTSFQPGSPRASSLPSLQRNRSLRDLESWNPGPRRTAEAVFALRSCSATEIKAFWSALVAGEPDFSPLKSLTLQRWMELDPQAAIAATAGTRDEFQAWTNWGEVDPIAALAASEAADRSCIRAVLRGCGSSDPHLAMKLAERYGDLDIRFAIASELKRTSYREALDYSYSLPLLRNWSTDEPRAAFDWAVENQSRVKNRRDWGPLVDSLFASDPAYLAESIRALPAGETRTMLEGLQARNALRDDPDSVLALVRADNIDPFAVPELGESLAWEHPEASLLLFREFEARHPHHAGVATNWICQLLAHDPNAVMQAAEELRNPLSRRAITDMWMTHDRYEYAEWLIQQPASGERDEQFRRLTWESTQDNRSFHHPDLYQEALGWAGEIDGEQARRHAIHSVLAPWMKTDPDALGRFFDSDARSADEQSVYEALQRG